MAPAKNRSPFRAAFTSAVEPVRTSVAVPLPKTLLSPAGGVPPSESVPAVTDTVVCRMSGRGCDSNDVSPRNVTLMALPLAAEKTSVASSATTCSSGTTLFGPR